MKIVRARFTVSNSLPGLHEKFAYQIWRPLSKRLEVTRGDFHRSDLKIEEAAVEFLRDAELRETGSCLLGKVVSDLQML